MRLAHETALRLGDLDVRPASREVVWRGGREVLQPRAMQVLVRLGRSAGEVVDRDDLIADCWDGRIVSEDAINFVVAQLRKLAARTGGFQIETVPRVGYRLVAADGGKTAVAGPPLNGDPVRAGLDRRLILAGGGVGIAALGAAAAGIWRIRAGQRERGGLLTVAVLPFTQVGARLDPNLAPGLAREVRNSLSRVAGLRVIDESSVAALPTQQREPREAAERLRADWLVDGSVTTSGDAVRIGLALLRPRDGDTIWTATVDGRLDDLFAAQDRMSSEVVEQLAQRVTAPTRRRPAPRQRDPRTFRDVLDAEAELARTRSLRVDPAAPPGDAAEAADRAASHANAALAIDEGEVRALLVLATLARNGWSAAVTPAGSTPSQRNAISADYIGRALLADPNDAAALAALGDMRRREWRWAEADSLLARAVAAGPNLVEARFAYGSLLATVGRGVEALAQAEELVRLDPIDGWKRGFLEARVRYLVGDRAGAVGEFHLLLDRGAPSLFVTRELLLMHLAEHDAASLEALAAALRARPGAEADPLAAMVRRLEAAAAAVRGRSEELLAMLDADVAAYDGGGAALMATQQGRTSADLLFLFAVEYAWAGATERAVALLDRALAAGGVWPASLPFGVRPFPAEVRAQPAYAAMWARDPRLIELAARRLDALRKRQMAGVLPDGRRVAPKA